MPLQSWHLLDIDKWLNVVSSTLFHKKIVVDMLPRGAGNDIRKIYNTSMHLFSLKIIAEELG